MEEDGGDPMVLQHPGSGSSCHWEVGREEVGGKEMGHGWKGRTPDPALKTPRENHPQPLLPAQQVLTKPILN